MKKFLLLGSSLLLSLCMIAQTPVAYYPFNGNANDAIGTLNGTVNGAVLTTDRFGNANSAYSFDGVNNAISFAALPMNNTDNFTLMAWVNPALFDPANQFNKMIISLGPGSNGYNMGMGNNSGSGSGNELGGLYNLVTWLHSGSFFSTINTWYHVALVRESGVTKFYMNAVLAPNTNSSTPFTPTAAFQIGGQDFDPTHYWNGKIDEVKIYNVALTALQIQQEYASSSQLQKPGSGNAISFDGSTQSINIPNTSSINFGTSDFSLAFWYNSANNGKAELVFEKRDDNCGDGQNWSVRKAADQIYLEVNVPGPASDVVTIPNAADSKWHHIVFTRTATQLFGFKDGMLIATTSAPAQNVNNSAPIQIATGPCSPFFPGGNGFFTGSLDDIQFWNTALTQAQIRDRMCKKITNTDPLYANLSAYYNFDENTGATVFDGTINANNGTLSNSPVRVTSGAAIGDNSAHNYVTTGLPAANISFTGQDNLAVAYTGGTFTGEAGTQVYVENEKPNTENAITGVGPNNRYFGVFNCNLTNPQYTATYNYTGNPFVSGTNEFTLALFKRDDNAATTWSNTSAALNTTANTLITTGQNTEYMLGSTGTALPLNLISFSGSKQNGTVQLSWSTNNEINTAQFVIERSNGTAAFIKIGTVQPLNVSAGDNYYLTDNTPFVTGAVQYYRLKIIDNNGRFVYSNILRLNNNATIGVSVFPNPVKDILTISSNKKQAAVITNTAGQVITTLQLINGSQTINVSILPSGVYFIKTEDGVTKIIKQ